MSTKFNANAVKTINQDTVEQDGSKFPAISFHNGDATQKKGGGVAYEGGWFIAEDGAPSDMTDYGWKKDSFISRGSGNEITGYWSPSISVSIICGRKRWVVNQQPFAWNQYDDAQKAGEAAKSTPRGHQQYLVLLKGAEELGPFVVALKGHAGMCFSGSRQYSSTGALACFNRTVIAAANAMTKPQKWPFRAFWLTIGGDKDAKGQPVFTEVGKNGSASKIVLPVPMGLPEKATDVNLDDYYVGDDVLSYVNQLFDENQSWATAWASFAANAAENTKAAPVEEELPEGL